MLGKSTPLKTNMDIQNDGLEKVVPFKGKWPFLLSMLNFWGVRNIIPNVSLMVISHGMK